jgi:broad specificity phosphatase PhoE
MKLEVTFIRHAESEDNIRVKALCEFILALCQGKLPSFEQLKVACGLLRYDTAGNSHLSVLGKRQAANMKMLLESRRFWEKGVDCIAHSTLTRATDTCSLIVPEVLRPTVIPLDLLREITPIEEMSKSVIKDRVAKLEKWLRSLPEGTAHVVVFGHCQYFNHLLGLKTLMRNCDVWRSTVTFDETPDVGTWKATWTAPKLLFRTALSEPHPVGRLYQAQPWLKLVCGKFGAEAAEEPLNNGDSNEGAVSRAGGEATTPRSADTAGIEVEDDLTDEPVCRICQVCCFDSSHSLTSKIFGQTCFSYDTGSAK